MRVFRRASSRPVALMALLALLPAPLVHPASTQLSVTARVLPTRQVAAANSTVYIVSPGGSRQPVQLSAQDKLAITAKPGFVPESVRNGGLAPGVHVIEINF